MCDKITKIMSTWHIVPKKIKSSHKNRDLSQLEQMQRFMPGFEPDKGSQNPNIYALTSAPAVTHTWHLWGASDYFWDSVGFLSWKKVLEWVTYPRGFSFLVMRMHGLGQRKVKHKTVSNYVTYSIIYFYKNRFQLRHGRNASC